MYRNYMKVVVAEEENIVSRYIIKAAVSPCILTLDVCDSLHARFVSNDLVVNEPLSEVIESHLELNTRFSQE